MAELQEITSGLRFPEGPVCLEDGRVLVVEIQAGTLTKVGPDGSKSVVAQTGGGPNGAAIGPDGKCYVCNNGGFEWHELGGLTVPGLQAADYPGGSLQRVALELRTTRSTGPFKATAIVAGRMTRSMLCSKSQTTRHSSRVMRW